MNQTLNHHKISTAFPPEPHCIMVIFLIPSLFIINHQSFIINHESSIASTHPSIIHPSIHPSIHPTYPSIFSSRPWFSSHRRPSATTRASPRRGGLLLLKNGSPASPESFSRAKMAFFTLKAKQLSLTAE